MKFVTIASLLIPVLQSRSRQKPHLFGGAGSATVPVLNFMFNIGRLSKMSQTVTVLMLFTFPLITI
jgi:hypothetical protein